VTVVSAKPAAGSLTRRSTEVWPFASTLYENHLSGAAVVSRNVVASGSRIVAMSVCAEGVKPAVGDRCTS
jgi:hypothetical protein